MAWLGTTRAVIVTGVAEALAGAVSTGAEALPRPRRLPLQAPPDRPRRDRRRHRLGGRRPGVAGVRLRHVEVSAGDALHDRSDLLRRGYARVADPDSADWVLAFAIDWALE